jgi:hypothetical protein
MMDQLRAHLARPAGQLDRRPPQVAAQVAEAAGSPAARRPATLVDGSHDIHLAIAGELGAHAVDVDGGARVRRPARVGGIQQNAH